MVTSSVDYWCWYVINGASLLVLLLLLLLLLFFFFFLIFLLVIHIPRYMNIRLNGFSGCLCF
jgi:sensor histidine kinase YesM